VTVTVAVSVNVVVSVIGGSVTVSVIVSGGIVSVTVTGGSVVVSGGLVTVLVIVTVGEGGQAAISVVVALPKIAEKAMTRAKMIRTDTIRVFVFIFIPPSLIVLE
jgi:hypothetical protein